MKGLVAFSSAMVVGTVASPRSRIAVTCAMRSRIAALSGSATSA